MFQARYALQNGEAVCMSEEFDLEYEAFLKALGTRIKQLRNERGLTLKDMTVRHNYHDSQWRRYERGGSINVQSLLRSRKLSRHRCAICSTAWVNIPQCLSARSRRSSQQLRGQRENR